MNIKTIVSMGTQAKSNILDNNRMQCLCDVEKFMLELNKLNTELSRANEEVKTLQTKLWAANERIKELESKGS